MDFYPKKFDCDISQSNKNTLDDWAGTNLQRIHYARSPLQVGMRHC